MLTDLPQPSDLVPDRGHSACWWGWSRCGRSADLVACIVFSAAAITDYFDGKLARSRRQQSDLGRMLDPIADKLLVGAVLMMLVGDGTAVKSALCPASSSCYGKYWSAGCGNIWRAIQIGLPVTESREMEDRLSNGGAWDAAGR